MKLRNVAIVGMGCLTPMGNDVKSYYEIAKTCCKDKQVSKEMRIKGYKFLDLSILSAQPRIDVTCKYLLSAVQQAVSEANLDINDSNKQRIGIVIGTKYGVINSQKKNIILNKKIHESNAIIFQHTANNLLAGLVAYKYGITGYTTVLFEDTLSSINATILATMMIEQGELDYAIVGGVDVLPDEEYLSRENMNKLLESKRILSCEGAAVLILAAEALCGREIGIKGQIISYKQYGWCDKRQVIKNIMTNEKQVDLYLINSNINYEYVCSKLQKMRNAKSMVMQLDNYIGDYKGSAGILQIVYALCSNAKRSMIINSEIEGRLSEILVEKN